MSPRDSLRAGRGFTLTELMIIIAIIGLLASVAVPAFTRYVRKSRVAEAFGQLNREWVGALTYYETDHLLASGALCPKQFPGPTGSWVENRECGCLDGGRCRANNPAWDSDGVWFALGFAIPDSHAYMPGFTGAGERAAAQFTAYVKGDLNCNGVLAIFQRHGRVDGNGAVTGDYQPQITNELE